MELIALIGFLILPVLGFFIALIGYFFDRKISNKKNKKGSIYSLIIAIFIGIVAFNYNPHMDYDLYRHHQIVKKMENQDVIEYKKYNNIEIMPYLISKFVAKTGNEDLLQFIVLTLGYFLLFYIINDYSTEKKISKFELLIIVLFTFFGFNVLNFLSGLWNYVAILIFSFSFYMDYYKKKNKIICNILYMVSFLFHNAMIFPIAFLIIFKISKNKFNIKTVVTSLIFLSMPLAIIDFGSQYLNLPILQDLRRMYIAYVSKNLYMHRFYGKIVVFIEISKLVIVILAILDDWRKNKAISSVNGYILLLSICILVLMPSLIVSIRFIMIIQIIGLIPIMNFLEGKLNKNKLLFIMIMALLTIIYIAYFLVQFKNQNFSNFISEGIFKNIVQIFILGE